MYIHWDQYFLMFLHVSRAGLWAAPWPSSFWLRLRLRLWLWGWALLGIGALPRLEPRLERRVKSSWLSGLPSIVAMKIMSQMNRSFPGHMQRMSAFLIWGNKGLFTALWVYVMSHVQWNCAPPFWGISKSVRSTGQSVPGWHAPARMKTLGGWRITITIP